LVAALRSNHWVAEVDQTGLHEGDSIRAFCRQVRDCPFLIAVIAENYLRKRWCLYELVNFFEVCRCDFREFSGRALAAAEVGQIDDPVLNHHHQEYCRQTFEAYLEENPHLDRWTQQQIEQLAMWSHQLSDMLGTLADELGKFGFAQLRAANYALVIDGLERKHAAARSGGS
jgi:hypothetical protein